MRRESDTGGTLDLFKARRALRVNAMRRGFGPGGHWIWKLPEDATDRAIYFRPDELRGFIAVIEGGRPPQDSVVWAGKPARRFRPRWYFATSLRGTYHGWRCAPQPVFDGDVRVLS